MQHEDFTSHQGNTSSASRACCSLMDGHLTHPCVGYSLAKLCARRKVESHHFAFHNEIMLSILDFFNSVYSIHNILGPEIKSPFPSNSRHSLPVFLVDRVNSVILRRAAAVTCTDLPFVPVQGMERQERSTTQLIRPL